MNGLRAHISDEKAELGMHGYVAFETGLVDDYYGRLNSDGIPLAELELLKPIATDMSNFAYTCSINGLAQSHWRSGETVVSGIVVPDLEIGWRIARTHITRFRNRSSNTYDQVDKHLYLSADEVVRINDDFNLDRPDCEFELGKILRSMAKILILNNLELTDKIS